MKIYLASGFFSQEENTVVYFWEKLLTELNMPYYSPRSESFDFRTSHEVEITKNRSDQKAGKEEKGEIVEVDLTSKSDALAVQLKESVIRSIFKNNLRRMEECTHMYGNLLNEDVGTAFEIGHFLGRLDIAWLWTSRARLSLLEEALRIIKGVKLNTQDPELLEGVNEKEAQVLDFINHYKITIAEYIRKFNEHLSVFNDKGNVTHSFITDIDRLFREINKANKDAFASITKNNSQKLESLVVSTGIIDDLRTKLTTFILPTRAVNPNNSKNEMAKAIDDLFEMINKIEQLDLKSMLKGVNLMCIDNRPIYQMLLLGVVSYLQAPVITYSRNNYGLNVMLSSSSTHFPSVNEMNRYLSNTNNLLENISYGKFDFTVDMD